MANKFVISRADDAGITPGTNQAMQVCVAAGTIRNVGLMIPGAARDEAVWMLKEFPKSVNIGIHATVTSEWEGIRLRPLLPADEVPSLVQSDGTFYKDTVQLHRTYQLNELLAEIEAQIHFAQDAGLRIDYLDTHMPFYWMEGVAEGLKKLAQKHDLVWGDGDLFPSLLQTNPPMPAWELGAAAARFDLAEAGKVYKWVTHPSLQCEQGERMYQEGQPKGKVVGERAEETQMLISPAFKDLLAEKEVTLLSYKEAALRLG